MSFLSDLLPKPTRYPGLAKAKKIFKKNRAKFYGDLADALADGANPYELFRKRATRARDRKRPMAPLYALWRDRSAGMSLRDCWEGSVPPDDMLVIGAGERGNLPETMRFLAKVVEVKNRNLKVIRGAVAMPIFLSLIMAGVQVAVGVKMIPIMLEIMPLELFPAAGYALYLVSEAVMTFWYLIYGIPVLLGLLFVLSLQRWTGKSRVWADRHLLPYSVYRDVRSGEFLMSLAALTQAQVSTHDAVTLMMKDAGGWMRWHLARMRHSLRSDHNVTKAIDTGLFSDEVYERILEYAERSGFEQGIRKIGLSTIEEVSAAIALRSTVLRNILVLGVGAFILFTLAAVMSIGMAASEAAQSGMM